MGPFRAWAREAAAIACGLVLACGLGAASSGAATSSSVVGASVPSATTIDTTACASGTANLTEFGSVAAGSAVATGTDCTIGWGSSNDTAMLRAHQADGYGRAMVGGADGTLDTAFGGDGKVLLDYGAGNGIDNAGVAAVQPDGLTVHVFSGWCGGTGTCDVGLVRYLADGSLDPTCDGDGTSQTDISGTNDRGYAVAVQPDGSIVVAGATYNGADLDVLVLRFTSGCVLDLTFSGDGYHVFDEGTVGTGTSVAVDQAGRILVGGRVDDDLFAARLSSVGVLDPGFAGDGVAQVSTSSGTDVAYDILGLPGGGVQVVAQSALNGSEDIGLVRLRPDGTLDPSFGDAGIAVVSTTMPRDYPIAGHLDPDGTLLVVGTATAGAGGNPYDVTGEIFGVRVTAAGVLDSTFSSDGIVVLTLGADNDRGTDVFIDPTGGVLISGITKVGTDRQAALVRLHRTGAPDNTFDTDGVRVLDFAEGAVDDEIYALAVTPGGVVTAVGSVWDFVTYRKPAAMRFSARSIPDYATGSADWASASSLFGICLRAVGAGASPDWATGSCTTVDSAAWRGAPNRPTVAGAKVAHTTVSGTSTTSSFRFGLKVAAGQALGTYQAPLTFEVVAPDA